MAYKSLGEDAERTRQAIRIVNTYLDTISPLEINISHELVVAVRKEVVLLKTSPDHVPLVTLFDEILERGIIVNLIDTYARFFNSDLFQRYLTKKH
jgi:hypothetical protein